MTLQLFKTSHYLTVINIRTNLTKNTKPSFVKSVYELGYMISLISKLYFIRKVS